MKNIKVATSIFALLCILFLFTSLLALGDDTKRGGAIYRKDGSIIEAKRIYSFGLDYYTHSRSDKIRCIYEQHNIEIDIYDPNIGEIEFLDCSGPSGTATFATLSILKKDSKKFVVEKAWIYGVIEYDFWDVVNEKVSRDKIDPREIAKIVFSESKKAK
jgi:hypothetical protein